MKFPLNEKNYKIRFRQFEFAYELGRVKMAYQFLHQALDLDSKGSIQLVSEIALLNSDDTLLNIIEDYNQSNEDK